MILLSISIACFILGFLSCYFITYNLDRNWHKKYPNNRRGIYINQYTSCTENKEEYFEVIMEVIEIDSTDTKSKVKIISMNCDRSKFNQSDFKAKVSSIVHNSWLDSDKIEWVNNRAKKREEVLKDVLGINQKFAQIMNDSKKLVNKNE